MWYAKLKSASLDADIYVMSPETDGDGSAHSYDLGFGAAGGAVEAEVSD